MAFYRSTLTIFGALPELIIGVYTYSVNNKATLASVVSDFNLEGM